MIPTTPITLEARIRMPEDENVCSLCQRWKESQPAGMTETYVAGTQDWVCFDCACGIDPELAYFAYCPERPRKRVLKPLDAGYGHFGVCPECGDPGGMLNVHKTHWIVCQRHGLRWCIGRNIFSGWQWEPEEVWERNAETLKRFREIDCRDLAEPNHPHVQWRAL
jgi:hypothetical protein